MIHSKQATIQPRIGQAMSLGVSHVDAATLTAVFHYYELVQVDGTWETQARQQTLVAGTHFTGNPVQGTITLLAHTFWQTEGRWRAADTIEPLLYKGRVKAPQYIKASFEHYAPAQVTIAADKKVILGNGTDAVALTVSAEDGSSSVPVAVYNGDGVKFATVQVAGTKALKATQPGFYRLEADRDALDPIWGIPFYQPALENGSVTVEVTSA